MNEVSLWVAIVTGFAGLLTGFSAALLRGRTDIDSALRVRREKEYAQLLDLTKRVSVWPPNVCLTYGQLTELESELRDWYYVSGLIMSKQTKSAYGNLQRALEARRLAAGAKDADKKPALSQPLAPPRPAGWLRSSRGVGQIKPLTESAPQPHVRGGPNNVHDDYDVVLELASMVRTRMTEDLLSRTRPLALRGRFWTRA